MQSPDFDSFIDQFGKKIFNVIYRICGDYHLAEDLFQESLFEIHKSLSIFRGESSFYTYAYRIAVNRTLREMKGRNVREIAVDSLKGQSENPVETTADSVRLTPDDEIVEKALMAEIREKCHLFMTYELTTKQRVAMVLIDLFDFTYEEAAFILDETVGVIKSRIFRARKRLKTFFEKRCSWLNPENPCRCEQRLSYVLAQYPELLPRLRKRANRSEYIELVNSQMNRTIHNETDILRSFPLMEIKLQPFLEKI